MKGSRVKPGAFVVDVGISRLEEGGLAGDVSPEVSEIGLDDPSPRRSGADDNSYADVNYAEVSKWTQ